MNPHQQKARLPRSFLQIEQAKQEWESTADSLPEVLCLLDSQTQIIRANRAIEAWRLGQVRNVKGRSLHALLHPDCQAGSCYLSRFLARAQGQIRLDSSAECEAWDQVLHRDVSVQLRPIFLAPEHRTLQAGPLAVSIISDITEQKRLERALHSREQEYHALVDQMAAPVAIVRQQRLLFVNQACIALFGYPRQKTYSMNPLDLFCQHSRDIVRAFLAATMTPVRMTQRWQATGLTGQGQELCLEVEQSLLTWEGLPAILLTFYDRSAHIRQIHRLEDEIVGLQERCLPFDPEGMGFHDAVEAFERYLLEKALRQQAGHQRNTSEMLNIPPKTLYRKIRKYGLKPNTLQEKER